MSFTPNPLLTAEFVGHVGVAREDITPPLGISVRNWGAAKHFIAEGVHRPLTLTALYLESRGAPLIVIAIDLGLWRSPADEWFIRGAVVEAGPYSPERVIVALSHTHSGPNTYREDASGPGTDLIGLYLEELRHRAVRAVQRAIASARPSRLSWRYGSCDLACNRDRPVLGESRFVVGANPAAEADRTLLVGVVQTEDDGRTSAVIVNYACHPTTLAWENRLLSPDYPGAMRDVVENDTGGLCLFLQGASGDLAPAEQYVGDPAVADRHGRRLGYAVLATLQRWTDDCLTMREVVESGAPLAVMRPAPVMRTEEAAAIRAELLLELKELPTIAETEHAMQCAADHAQRERLRRQLALRRRLGDGSRAVSEVWVWRLGEALWIAQPNELYSAAQLELRRQFHPRPVIVIGLANGCSSYLAPKALYGQNQYAANTTPFAAGGFEHALEAMRTLAARLA